MTKVTCEDCEHWDPLSDIAGCGELRRTGKYPATLTKVECVSFEKRTPGPFVVELHRGHITGRATALVARFPGHYDYWVANNRSRKEAERICAWLNERWTERKDDD